MSVTGIVAALKAEARVLGQLPTGRLLATSGMGPQAAARAAAGLIAQGADSLLSFGLAGALDPQLRAGAVVVPQNIMDAAHQVHAADELWRARLTVQALLVAGSPGVSGGSLLSVAQPLATVESKSRARSSSGACAVDMESVAIAQVAAQRGVKFAVVRVIIDGATDALPRSVIRATGEFGELNLPRLLAGLMAAPAELPALLRLPWRYRAARRALRRLGRLDLGAP